jgi:hypothetical protein
VPLFDPGGYAEDDDIPMLAAKLEHAAPAQMVGDFVPDYILGTITKLVEDQTHRDANKKAEWLREQAVQDSMTLSELQLVPPMRHEDLRLR